MKPSRMFLGLHADIADEVTGLIPSVWFNPQDSDAGCRRKYSTHVMGKFFCHSRSCQTKCWGSKKVAILIRGYDDHGYNAVVYGQRCKECDRLGRMVLDEDSYVDRVTYRIMRWAGVGEIRDYVGGREGPPHETE
ncbi:hypothetical protein BU24DRAFT_418695, partial [Aaosphaeria arxii CBS 175.79]